MFRPRERFCNIAAASEPADAEPQASSEGFEAARSGVIGKTVLEDNSEAVGTMTIVVEVGVAWERDGRTTTVVVVGTSRPA